MDTDRLPQFEATKRAYDAMPQAKEFLIPTRSHEGLEDYLREHGLYKGVRLLPYTVDRGFNVSKALNMGVRAAKYNTIIVSSPEVVPKTNVLHQLEPLIGHNVICQVHDENERHELVMSLVNSQFRHTTPAYYFLAMFNKADIEAINGWDEDFMKGYAYEDDDFGARWVRAGLPFEIHDEIQAIHQYHPRSETVPGGFSTNAIKFEDNNELGVIRCRNGLVVLD